MLPSPRYAEWESANHFRQLFCRPSSTRSLQSSPPGQPHTATMGSGKKEAARKERQGKTGDGMGNVKVKGENFYRYAQQLHCTALQLARNAPANTPTALRRRSRSSSASLTARPRGTPPETLPRPPHTSRARRPSPASSPTGSGSTTPASSPRMHSTLSAPPCRRRPPTPPPSS